MDKNKKTKNLVIIIIVIIAIVGGVYYFYSSKKPKGETAIIDMDQGAVGADENILQESQKIFSLLDELNSVKLDVGFFEGKFFRSLIDFSVELVPEPVGRENPFAPL